MAGKLAGKPLAIMAGRIHVYEGHPPQTIATLVRILKSAGAERLILTNASGGLTPEMVAGTLMIVTDHINFSGVNPLIGANDESVGPRFPDLTNAYDPDLRALLLQAAQQAGVPVKQGIYLYLDRPQFRDPRRGALCSASSGPGGGHVHRAGNHRGPALWSANRGGLAGDKSGRRPVAAPAQP